MARPSPSVAAMGSTWAIVVAAGSGSRFGGAKQYAPLLGRRVVDAVLAGADVAVPVVAVVDTVTDEHGAVVDRDRLRVVQTPQGFSADTLARVHASKPEATDDASLVVAAGGRLRQVSGERWNLKVTEPSDLHVAETILGTR